MTKGESIPAKVHVVAVWRNESRFCFQQTDGLLFGTLLRRFALALTKLKDQKYDKRNNNYNNENDDENSPPSPATSKTANSGVADKCRKTSGTSHRSDT